MRASYEASDWAQFVVVGQDLKEQLETHTDSAKALGIGASASPAVG